MYLTELLDGAASRWPHKPALIDGDSTVTYAGLVDAIAGWASRLQALGLKPGDRVGLCHPNGITYVALTFALWRNGAVVVPVPEECAEEEVSRIASTMRLAAMLGRKGPGPAAALQPGVFHTRLAPALPADNHGLNVAFIRFTSGTTSARKGVVLCHETVRDRVLAANKALRIGPDDTVMWCLPMSHHFLVTIVLYLSQGATIVLARHVLAGPFLASVNRWRGTVLYAAPFHHALLARDASGAGLPSVRLAVSTTCALPQEVAEGFHQRFGLPLAQAFGVIELGLVCANVDDPLARWNSVGRCLPDFAVTILNPDDNGCGEVRVAGLRHAEVAAGASATQAGLRHAEVAAGAMAAGASATQAGSGFFDAYADPWTPREQLMPDGWFGTGDIGRVDSEGFLYLVSRNTTVINLAGRKVFPEEIEAVLNRHPAVRESRVYGAAHPRLGEVIEAEVALRAAVEPGALRDFCRAHVGPDKIPTRVHVVPSVARTAVTGKVRRPAPVAAP